MGLAVVRPPQPPDPRLPQAHQSAGAGHTGQFVDGHLRARDRLVTQHRDTQDDVEGPVGERQALHVGRHEPGGLVLLAVQIERERHEVTRDELTMIGEPRAGRTGPGSDVEEATTSGRLGTEQLLQQLTCGVVPPVRVFDLRHAAVLLDFHG